MNKTVLVVDDDLDARTILRVFLMAEGFYVIEATDGYDAVEKALKHSPDLVIMDMAMPLMDGVNSIRTIRQHDSLQGIPILGLTAFTDFYTWRAMEAGCTVVLHKPVDFGRLKPAVNKYLN
jgi:DNA-binding response OmpR family regulator